MTEQIDPFTQQQGQTLLKLARKTLLAHFGLELPDLQADARQAVLQDPALRAECGAFVTLKKEGQLRGCIGTLEGREPLVENVRANAINAAFHDPRFRPLKKDELDKITIEVSVLSRPQPLDYKDAQDLIAKLEPGVDGVIIRKGPASATFLPQVWDQLPKAEDFLCHLCLKAGLKADAWRDGQLNVDIYQVQYFEESH